MSNLPKAAVYIPTQTGSGGLGDKAAPRAADLIAFCTQARDLGFESAWVVDHLLTAQALYATSWIEPFSALAAVAGVADLRLGTGILVAPTRSPIITVKTVDAIQKLAGSQMILGIGAGWYQKEFEAVGVSIRQRGSRTDEFLDVLDLMYSGGGSYHGAFHNFDGLVVGDLGPPPEIYIAGGSQASPDGVSETLSLSDKVTRRVARYGKWFLRPTVGLAQAKRDKASIEAAMNGRALKATYINFMHLIDTADEEEAIRLQGPLFYRLMSEARPLDVLRSSYFMGSVDSIRQKINEWSDLGLERIVIHPLGDFSKQLELWKRHLGDMLAFEGSGSNRI